MRLIDNLVGYFESPCSVYRHWEVLCRS